jgi:DNA-binding transcriptional ArsR family regulator
MMGNLHRLFFKAFSNETRLEIINLLKEGPLTVTEICDKTGFEQSRVSHNLKCLENCGFLTSEQNWKWKRYFLDKETILPMVKLFDKHTEKYHDRLKSCGVIRNEKILAN